MASITLRGVSKIFGDNPPVLRDVDLEIGTNELCVFLGPSGCGKSTLLRIIAGLDDPTGGDVIIGGERVNTVPAAKRGVAMVFQSYALFPHMTVAENMGFGLKLARMPLEKVKEKVNEAARILQLEPFLDRKPKALSGGQRQRVAIGRAIVRQPGVFLFDEPLSNLDATLRGQTRLEIARLHARFSQASTVYVTHDQIEAMTLADKIVLLNAGRNTEMFGSIAQVGEPLDLYHRPNSRFVAGFIGSPQMNFLTATVSDLSPKGVVVELNGGGDKIQTGIPGEKLQLGQPVTLGIRPEHFRVLEEGNGGGDEQASRITRTINLIERLGEQTYLHVDDTGGTSLMAKVQGNSRHRPGDTIVLELPPVECHIFTEDGRSALCKQPGCGN